MGFIQKSLCRKILFRLCIIISITTLIVIVITSQFAKKYIIDESKKKTTELATMISGLGQDALLDEISKGTYSVYDFMSFKYKKLSINECIDLWGAKKLKKNADVKKVFSYSLKKKNGSVDSNIRYMTSYSSSVALGKKIRKIEDHFLKTKGVSFAVLMDKNGFVPFHHSRNSKKIIGKYSADVTANRTNRKWDYLGKMIKTNGPHTNTYIRDTGSVMILTSAPIHLKGKFWGGIVLGYKITDINEKISALTFILVAIIGFGFFILFISLGIIINKNLDPISTMVSVLRKVANGDFSQNIHHKSKDEIGVMSQGLNDVINFSNKTISYMQTTAASLSASSEELAATSATIGNNTNEQVNYINDVKLNIDNIMLTLKSINLNIVNQMGEVKKSSAAIKDLESSSEEIATNMSKVKSLSDTSISLILEGSDKVNSATDKMKSIVDVSEKISTLLSSIDVISEQIHMLSLNASIEAARAGAQGAGFAVVASEIGKLADNSSSLVKEIHVLSNEIYEVVTEGREIVSNIRNDNDVIKDNVIQYTELIEETNVLTSTQNYNHQHIGGVMSELNKESQNIICAIDEQNNGINSMVEKINATLSFATETSTGAEELAVSSEDLSMKATELSSLIEQYKLSSGKTINQIDEIPVFEANPEIIENYEQLKN